MKTVQQLAEKYFNWLESAKRVDGTDYIRLRKEDEDIKALIYDAHNGMMPDDFKYQFIHEALELIAESTDMDEIVVEADFYNRDLLRWVSSNLTRADYVDDAVAEYGYSCLYDALRDGRLKEKDEILQSVRNSLEKIVK